MKMLPVLWGIGVLARFITAPLGFIHISLLLFNERKLHFEKYRQPMIFPWDTGHRVKNHRMIQNEVFNEKTTQVSQSGV
jgi:hypothetical protein